MADRYAEIHKDANGPGDARPIAKQIIDDENLVGKLGGKVILITGASGGLGLETARALYPTGATLYLTARDLEKGKTALGELANSERVHLLELDLESLASVRDCASQVLSQSKTLNILINNAGVMATPEGKTKDGFETQIGTNHLAHFLLFNLVKERLLESSTPDFNSRAVILSSIAHRNGTVNFDNLNLEGVYDPLVAYSQSKLANLWTSNEIERRYGSKGLHSWSVQPGGINTGLLKHLTPEVKGMLEGDASLMKIFKTPEQGAATTTWAAVAKALEGKGGRYLEDVQIVGPWNPEQGLWSVGYGPPAYDEKNEARLWARSLELVGLEDDA
ncbi:oxidoreductase [Phlyctema vagabunda]|uniref:Oxidoreductase n=1 Tax=Phlyctema vagabunda TaxID=108571 RepID=A0ABR4PB56_9HELO